MKNTAPQLMAPQMKNIVTKIAPTISHPRRSRTVINALAWVERSGLTNLTARIGHCDSAIVRRR